MMRNRSHASRFHPGDRRIETSRRPAINETTTFTADDVRLVSSNNRFQMPSAGRRSPCSVRQIGELIHRIQIIQVLCRVDTLQMPFSSVRHLDPDALCDKVIREFSQSLVNGVPKPSNPASESSVPAKAQIRFSLL
jgi:hypothetical protein